MSAGQAVFSGWMEIADKAVNDEADRHAEEAALAGLVSQYAGTLYRVAYSVLRNAADAEDAVQEAFLRVLRHRETLHEVRDQRVWLIRIVWNVVLDRKRRTKTRPETDDVAELARVLPADGLSAEERAAAAQHHAHVLACVEQLARQRAPGADALGLRGAEQRGDCLGAGHHRVQRPVAPVSRAQPDGRPAGSCEEFAMKAGNRDQGSGISSRLFNETRSLL